MSKEIDLRNGPIESIWKSEKILSNKYGGRLFSIFGRGDGKALLFPTPLEIENDNAIKQLFLAATINGFKIIKVEKGIGSEEISEIINVRLGNGPKFWSKAFWKENPFAYDQQGKLVLGHLAVLPDAIKRIIENDESAYSCVLRDAKAEETKQILDINIKRAEGELDLSKQGTI